MHHPTIHLLRSIGRQAVTAVAIVALLLSVLGMPCLPFAGQGSDQVLTAPLAEASIEVGGGCLDAHDLDECGHCHCSAMAFCVIPDAMASISMCIDDRDAQRPTSSRVPDGPARTPDVPPDQV